MTKYHFIIFLKNDNYMCELPDSKKLDMLEYLIRFKGIFDSISQGLDHIRNTFGTIMKENSLTLDDLSDYMSIMRINTSHCTKYEQMFMSQI